jgi:Raf kinase inhibitor-like YbhB/YbcL family protein
VGAGGRRAALAALAALAGCGGGHEAAAPPGASAPDLIRLSSPAFADGAAIPKGNTCDGAGTAPALTWRGVPATAKELVLVVEDPDAPGGTYVHWTAFGIPGAAARLPAGVPEGANSAGEAGWTPPCPPEGDTPHRYVFTLFALARASGLKAGAEPAAVRAALSSGAVARGRLTGTYGR